MSNMLENLKLKIRKSTGKQQQLEALMTHREYFRVQSIYLVAAFLAIILFLLLMLAILTDYVLFDYFLIGTPLCMCVYMVYYLTYFIDLSDKLKKRSKNDG